jgi:Protein of unknown function (DUF4236)
VSIRFRKRIPILPFLRLNLSRAGATWTFHIGPWSWNTRSRRNRIDLPGPLSWQQDRRGGFAALAGVAVVTTVVFLVAVAIGGVWGWHHIQPYLTQLNHH